MVSRIESVGGKKLVEYTEREKLQQKSDFSQKVISLNLEERLG